jgi:hypothetical protein
MKALRSDRRALAALLLGLTLLCGSPAAAATCGNGLLEPGEICEACEADCRARPCDSDPAQPVGVDVAWQPPRGVPASSLTVLVAYRQDRLFLPTGAVEARVSETPGKAIVGALGLGYGAKVSVSRAGDLVPGRLFRLKLDRCKGAAAPAASDFACAVQGCASASGDVKACTCSVELTSR